MRDGARLAAAIEFIGELATGQRRLDRYLKDWARRHRYAGSKDRAAIVDRVYTVLRRRQEVAYSFAGDDPRRLVLGSLIHLDGLDLDAVEALCAEQPHGPGPLTDAERVALAKPRSLDDAPDWVAGNYPEWLDGELGRAFGDNRRAEMQALAAPAPVDIRANTLQCDRDSLAAILAESGIHAEPTPISPFGLRLGDHRPLTTHPLFEQGWFEVQDEGSQLATLCVGTEPGMQVLDLCAGAGGKSLALAAMMENRGQVYACDADVRRLDRLRPRMKRAKARAIQPRPADPLSEEGAATLDDLVHRIDRVLLDVPCSGTGAWRRRPEAKWQLDQAAVDRYRGLQARLLDAGARFVGPDGWLVYVTCSVLPSENEDQVEAFLKRFPEFHALDWGTLWPSACPMPEFGEGPFLRLSPATTGTDGFFVAVLGRD